MPQVGLDVGFVDDEVDADGAVAPGRGEDRADQIGEADVLLGRDVDEEAAFVLGEGRTGGEADDAGQILVRPVEVEVLDHAAAARRVWIDVEGDVGAFLVGRIDEAQRVDDLAPVLLAGRLVMRYVH